MYLAYLDESDTKAKQRKWQVMCAVIIKDDAFKMAEIGVSNLPEKLMGADNIADFEEFHACELYGGYGVFKDIEQERRFETISRLIAVLDITETRVVYGAVDIEALKNEEYASADPVDICFRKCLRLIKQWADEELRAQVQDVFNKEDCSDDEFTEAVLPKMLNNLIFLVADECDSKIKNQLQKSFRGLRPRNSKLISNCFHEDLYFGDSRYSIGIQLADLCAYFIARHLEGDSETAFFYHMIKPRIYPPIKKTNLELLAEIGANENTESGISDIREGDGDDLESRSQIGEIGDGDGEAAKADGGRANGKAQTGQTP